MKNAMHHSFTGRKPSQAQIISNAIRLANKGADFIGLTWGENWIDLTLVDGYWHGAGWFKDIGGDFVARDMNHNPKLCLNRAMNNPVQFMRDHFTVIHIS